MTFFSVTACVLLWGFITITFSVTSSEMQHQKGCLLDNDNQKLSCMKVISYNNRTNDTVARSNFTKEISSLDLFNMSFNTLHEVASNFSKLRHHFKFKIKELKLSNSSIENLGYYFHPILGYLHTLDLRGNNLKGLSYYFAVNLNKIHSIYLSKNQWDCSMDLEWVLSLNTSSVKDLNELTCYGDNYRGKPLTAIAMFQHDLREQCPDKCDCSLPNVVQDPGTRILQPIVALDCSEMDLSAFPENLPNYTTILRLEGNKIEDLAPLKKNQAYKTVQDLYLDNNRIKSISILEGTYWLSHFRVLSLTGNKLTQLPTYALENALEQNPNMPKAVRIYFGGNPWRCDCVFVPGFQDMLRKYEHIIQDIEEVQCSYVEGDENSLNPVSEVSRASVCRLPTEYSIRALDLLNATLASLIVLILGKLAYDYYNFKKTGRLPWIVTKMP